MHILVVTSDDSLAATAREQLRSIEDGQVTVASAIDDALCTARSRRADVDLVILDLDAVNEEGLTACRRLSTLLAAIPILTCSKQVDDEMLARAFDAGAHDFITKPVRPMELELRAKAALRVRAERLQRALYEQRLVQWAHQLEKSNRDLESTVRIDQLTGVANRRHFDMLLRAEWRRAVRDQTMLSMVFFDFDDFHAFNDRYGHVGGDACLAKVADALARSLRRASDVLSRYGGEEFVAILPDTDANGACVVGERLRARIEELQIPHAAARCSRVVTISAGVATRTPSTGSTPESLIAAADAALFRAKADGRNCFRAENVDVTDIAIRREPWPACPVVVLDPILVHRVPRFLDSIRSELASLESLEQVSASALRVRRAADGLGFRELVELANGIDEASRGRNDDVVSKLISEMSWYVDHVQVVYRRAALKAV